MPEPAVVTINGVEVFASGTHNGDVYSEADLDGMISAAGQVGFTAPLKLGHMSDGDTQTLLKAEGMPAFGYVKNLRRVGQKLLADFVNVPKRLGQLIKNGAYRRVSAEIYWNYKNNQGAWPRVLKAVALLGGEIPAVTNLREIEALYSRKDQAGQDYKTYWGEVLPITGGGEMLVDAEPTPMPPPVAVQVGPFKEKGAVGYRLATEANGPACCGTCKFYTGGVEERQTGVCALVSGAIASDALCDLYEPTEAYEFEELYAKDPEFEKKHPRGGKGTPGGGKFIEKPDGGDRDPAAEGERAGAIEAGSRWITTRNTEWGFHGTVSGAEGYGEDKAREAFHHMARSLMEQHSLSSDDARDLLDSTLGRHIADAYVSDRTSPERLRSIVNSAVKQWKRAARRHEAEDEPRLYVGQEEDGSKFYVVDRGNDNTILAEHETFEAAEAAIIAFLRLAEYARDPGFEAKHPRGPAGTPAGGKFIDKPGTGKDKTSLREALASTLDRNDEAGHAKLARAKTLRAAVDAVLGADSDVDATDLFDGIVAHVNTNRDVLVELSSDLIDLTDEQDEATRNEIDKAKTVGELIRLVSQADTGLDPNDMFDALINAVDAAGKSQKKAGRTFRDKSGVEWTDRGIKGATDAIAKSWGSKRKHDADEEPRIYAAEDGWSDVYLDRETVAALCPTCAETMAAENLRQLKLYYHEARDEYGGFELYKKKTGGGFSEGLCDKFGEDKGFRTRCIEAMDGKVDSPGGFCNALETWCRDEGYLEGSAEEIKRDSAEAAAKDYADDMAAVLASLEDAEELTPEDLAEVELAADVETYVTDPEFESKHPRGPEGTPAGGKFAPKPGGSEEDKAKGSGKSLLSKKAQGQHPRYQVAMLRRIAATALGKVDRIKERGLDESYQKQIPGLMAKAKQAINEAIALNEKHKLGFSIPKGTKFSVDAELVVVEQHDHMIKKRGDKWCVLTKDGSKTLGCHDTEAEAKAQLAAVEISKAKAHAVVQDGEELAAYATREEAEAVVAELQAGYTLDDADAQEKYFVDPERSEGAKRGWDKRGRGRKKDGTLGITRESNDPPAVESLLKSFRWKREGTPRTEGVDMENYHNSKFGNDEIITHRDGSWSHLTTRGDTLASGKGIASLRKHLIGFHKPSNYTVDGGEVLVSIGSHRLIRTAPTEWHVTALDNTSIGAYDDEEQARVALAAAEAPALEEVLATQPEERLAALAAEAKAHAQRWSPTATPDNTVVTVNRHQILRDGNTWYVKRGSEMVGEYADERGAAVALAAVEPEALGLQVKTYMVEVEHADEPAQGDETVSAALLHAETAHDAGAAHVSSGIVPASSGGGQTAMTSEELKKLQDDLAAARVRIVQLEQELGKAYQKIEANARATEENAKMHSTIAELQAKVVEMETRDWDREDKIILDNLVAAGKLLPAEREIQEKLLTASRGQVQSYAENGVRKERPMRTALLEALEKRPTVMQFGEVVRTDGGGDGLENQDPAVELSNRIAKFRETNNAATYEQAYKAVLSANPKLKQRYAQRSIQ